MLPPKPPSVTYLPTNFFSYAASYIAARPPLPPVQSNGGSGGGSGNGSILNEDSKELLDWAGIGAGMWFGAKFLSPFCGPAAPACAIIL